MNSPASSPLRLPSSLLCLGTLASLTVAVSGCTPEPSPIDPFATTATTMQMTTDTDSATATVGDETTTDTEGDSDDPTDDPTDDPSASCGDGVVDEGEECDLGPDNSETGQCTPACLIATCGDGYVYEGFEECDDGNPVNTDECVDGCLLASCGDGFVQEGVEACDDGNDIEDDGCTSSCSTGVCGDGIVQPGEQCDDANDDTSDNCPACQFAFCGDGYIQAGVEVCDDGNLEDNDGCVSPMCVPAECGDGYVYEGMEECDDGNEDNGDACVEGCAEAFCGDGFVHQGVEVCDGPGCSEACDEQFTVPYCLDVLEGNPNAENGMYLIDPDFEGPFPPTEVYCDMDAGGHTVWALEHDWGEWGANMTIVIRDRAGVPAVGSQQDWSDTCQLFGTTNYVGSWKNTGRTYTLQQYQVWADANDYWLNYATQMFPDITYDDILILQDSQSSVCWAHYAEEGCMSAFGSAEGGGFAFCRNGNTANKPYHIYLCL